MKVGVFLVDYSPEAGGGYTIQEDIYQSLLELVDESRHTFVIFHNRKLSANGYATAGPDRLQFVSYSQPNLIERLTTRCGRESATFRMLWKRPSRLDRIAREVGVEFMWLVSALPVQLDLPYLTIVWDLQHRLQPWFPEVSANGVWDRREAYYSWFLRRATAIIAGTGTGREEIERFYQVPRDRIRILPHPTPQFALNVPAGDGNHVLEKYGLPSGYLFYPAQFWAHKNHANLLLAVRRLRDEFKLTFTVVFVGADYGNQAYIRQLADQLDLRKEVYFLGFVPQRDLIALYRNAFALTYVTFFGPENLPPLEAFALGCPVIASRVAGAQEQFGDAALLVDPKSPKQIALGVKALYDDPVLRKTLVQRGFDRATKWTGRDFVRGVFSILDEFEPVRRCWGNITHALSSSE